MKSSFSRNFSTAAAILLVALVILGASFQLQVKKFLTNTTVSDLRQDAEVIANLAASYSVDGRLNSRDFLLNLDVISQVSGADAVICDSQGFVVLCSDARSGCSHIGMQLNQEYLKKVISSGGDTATGFIRGLYDDSRYIVSVPILSGSEATGIVMVSVSTSLTTQILNRISNIFLTAAIFVVVVLSLIHI